MKKTLILFLVSTMILTLTACGNNDKEISSNSSSEYSDSDIISDSETVNEEQQVNNSDSVGDVLLADFRSRIEAEPDMNVLMIADAVLSNSIIPFNGMTIPVENGLLTGFGNTEITGFKDGVMFAPSISSIPFVGYIFTLDDNGNIDEFVNTLKESADPRWNICTEAEQTIVENEGNTVFFLMCPNKFEDVE